jgi:hypothetical protein
MKRMPCLRKEILAVLKVRISQGIFPLIELWLRNEGTPSKPVSIPAMGESSKSKTKGTSTFRGWNFERLTDTEMQEKSSKWLCLHCDERFGLGHVSANKQFNVLIMDDDIIEDEETPIPKYETVDLKNLQLSRFTSKDY